MIARPTTRKPRHPQKPSKNQKHCERVVAQRSHPEVQSLSGPTRLVSLLRQHCQPAALLEFHIWWWGETREAPIRAWGYYKANTWVGRPLSSHLHITCIITRRNHLFMAIARCRNSRLDRCRGSARHRSHPRAHLYGGQVIKPPAPWQGRAP